MLTNINMDIFNTRILKNIKSNFSLYFIYLYIYYGISTHPDNNNSSVGE